MKRFDYVKTHQIVHIEYVQFFVYQLWLKKAVKKKWKNWGLEKLSNSSNCKHLISSSARYVWF